MLDKDPVPHVFGNEPGRDGLPIGPVASGLKEAFGEADQNEKYGNDVISHVYGQNRKHYAREDPRQSET
jgi:hypothetical protein